MGTAFSDKENEMIRQNLKRYVLEYTKKYGIKKTSVDQLVAAVNISKGSFYKFYPTKELLFFEALEDLHEEISTYAALLIKENSHLPVVEQVTNTLYGCLCRIEEYFRIDSIQDELNYLLRKIPPEVIGKHITDEEDLFVNLVTQFNLPIKKDPTLFSPVFHALCGAYSYQQSLGEKKFKEILYLLIHAICREFFDPI